MKSTTIFFIIFSSGLMTLATANSPSLTRVVRQSNEVFVLPEPTTADPTKSYLQCQSDYSRMICKYGYQRLVAETYLNCGENSAAMVFAGQCDAKSDGEYCLEPYLADLDMGNGVGLHHPRDANRKCLDVAINEDQTCSQTCQTALADLKAHYGCCVNSILNNTMTSSRIYSYRLWEKCDVETPAKCDSSMNIDLVHEASVCSEEELLTSELQNLRCTSGNRFLLDKMLTEIGDCEEFITLNKQWCLRNEQGEYCSQISQRTAAMMKEVYQNCSSTQDECPADCKSALKGLKDGLGCCVDSTYDSEYYLTYGKRLNLTNDKLWQQCDIAPPPRACANMLDGAQGSRPGYGSVIVSATVVFLLAVETILT